MKQIIKNWLKSRCWHNFEFDRGFKRISLTGVEYQRLIKKCTKCDAETIGSYPVGAWERIQTN